MPIPQRIVFERPVATVFGAGHRRRDIARIHEHGNRHGNCLLMNQIVEDNWNAKRSVLTRITRTIHEDHEVCRLFGFVLGRHIHTVLPHGSRKNLAVRELRRCDPSLGNA